MVDSTAQQTLVVASSSPRRRSLIAALQLKRCDIDVQFMPAEIDEASFGVGLAPGEMVRAIATAKGRAIAQTRGASATAPVRILGADTMVVFEGEALGKPIDDGEVERMLAAFSGNTIHVVTGLALLDGAGAVETAETMTAITLHPITPVQIGAYVASGAGRDKAGALELQGAAADFIADVAGCWTNVVGLPLCELSQLLALSDQALETLGVNEPSAPSRCTATEAALWCHRSNRDGQDS